MLVRAYRLTREEFAGSAFDGEGARIHGGRWSSQGVPLVYASDSVPLAMLEVLVHLPAPRLIEGYCLIAVGIPERLIETLALRKLPKDWRESPIPASTRQIGDEWWASRRTAVLRAPSALEPGSHNLLIDPLHPDFKRIRIGKPQRFPFDSRLAR